MIIWVVQVAVETDISFFNVIKAIVMRLDAKIVGALSVKNVVTVILDLYNLPDDF